MTVAKQGQNNKFPQPLKQFCKTSDNSGFCSLTVLPPGGLDP